MKHTVITTLLFCSYSLYSQTQSVGLTDNTTGTFFNFTNNPVTGSPSLNGNIGINFDELGPNLFLATSTIGTTSPAFRSIDALDLPVADNTSQAGIVSTTTQIFGGAKTFSSSIAISGTSGNTFALETSGFVYDASNNRIGINTASPTYFFDLIAPSPTITYYTHRNSEGNESLLLDFSSDNIRFGLIDATGLTTVKLRSNSVSFIQNHFMVGDNANDDDNPQFKVVGTQDYSEGNTSWVNYQSTVQNHTDTNGESASIGFGVDATKTVIGGYISFVRTANPSKGGLHFGVYNSAGTSIDDVLTLEEGQATFNKQTASRIAVFNSSKNLVSGTTGSGLILSSDVLSIDINGLTEETNVDRNSDYVAIYDASAGTIDKAKMSNLSLGVSYQGVSNEFNPADATNYYVGSIPHITGTTPDINRIYIAKSGIIKAVYFYNGTAGSSETSTVSIKINSTIFVNVGSVQNNSTSTYLGNTSIDRSVSQGDYLEIKWATPTWTTNPTDVSMSYVVYIE
jgi:hypothetical protein